MMPFQGCNRLFLRVCDVTVLRVYCCALIAIGGASLFLARKQK